MKRKTNPRRDRGAIMLTAGCLDCEQHQRLMSFLREFGIEPKMGQNPSGEYLRFSIPRQMVFTRKKQLLDGLQERTGVAKLVFCLQCGEARGPLVECSVCGGCVLCAKCMRAGKDPHQCVSAN